MVHDTFAQVFVDAKLVSVIMDSVHKIARSGVKIKVIDVRRFMPTSLEQTVRGILW